MVCCRRMGCWYVLTLRLQSWRSLASCCRPTRQIVSPSTSSLSSWRSSFPIVHEFKHSSFCSHNFLLQQKAGVPLLPVVSKVAVSMACVKQGRARHLPSNHRHPRHCWEMLKASSHLNMHLLKMRPESKMTSPSFCFVLWPGEPSK